MNAALVAIDHVKLQLMLAIDPAGGYYDSRMKQLRQVVRSYLNKTNVKGAREALCARAGVSISTLNHILSPKGASYPLSRDYAERIALACDLSKEEALALAGDTTSDGQDDPPEAA